MLGFLEKLTREPEAVAPDDVAPLRAAGLTHEAIEDAVHVCAGFNVIVRVADAFEFALSSADGYAAMAQNLLKRGYA